MPFFGGYFGLGAIGGVAFTGSPIEPALRALLLAAQDVAAIVADRVYIEDAPEDERRPRVTLFVVADNDPHTLAEHGGYLTGRAQVNCLAASIKDARLLAVAVRNALDSKSGTVAGCQVDWIKAHDSRPLPALALAGQAKPTYGIARDFTFMCRP